MYDFLLAAQIYELAIKSLCSYKRREKMSSFKIIQWFVFKIFNRISVLRLSYENIYVITYFIFTEVEIIFVWTIPDVFEEKETIQTIYKKIPNLYKWVMT